MNTESSKQVQYKIPTSVKLVAGATAFILLCGSAWILCRVTKGKKTLSQDVIDNIERLGDAQYVNGGKYFASKYFIDLVALITCHVRNEFR